MAARILAEIQALAVRNTPEMRAVRRRHSQALKGAGRTFVLDSGRELVVHDPEAVEGSSAEHEALLAAWVKREVRNKPKTGLKSPRRRSADL